VFENRVLRETFGPKSDEVTGGGEKYTMRSLMICTPHKIQFGCSNEMGGSRDIYGRQEKCIQRFCGETRRTSLKRPRYRWQNNIKIDKEDGTAWTGFLWLRTGAGLVNM
jgi:hypothetical protein